MVAKKGEGTMLDKNIHEKAKHIQHHLEQAITVLERNIAYPNGEAKKSELVEAIAHIEMAEHAAVDIWSATLVVTQAQLPEGGEAGKMIRQHTHKSKPKPKPSK
jgi:hypothetical protein